jgi:acyl dehydratase
MAATIHFDDLSDDQTFTSTRRTITEADIVGFAGLSGDFNPLHTDEVFAREETPFGRRIAHGLLGLAVGSGLKSELDDLYVLAFLEVQRRFKGPIFPGDTIHAEYRVASRRRSESKPDRGVVILNVELVNQDGTVVQTGQDTVLVGVRPGAHGCWARWRSSPERAAVSAPRSRGGSPLTASPSW